jgi:hypothetical protein
LLISSSMTWRQVAGGGAGRVADNATAWRNATLVGPARPEERSRVAGPWDTRAWRSSVGYSTQ